MVFFGYWALVGEVRLQRNTIGGLLVYAAAMAETAVGESPTTGELLALFSQNNPKEKEGEICVLINFRSALYFEVFESF